MSREKVKNAVENRVKELQYKKTGIATNVQYQLGVVSGMLNAFWAIGAITESERKEIHSEILEEYF